MPKQPLDMTVRHQCHRIIVANFNEKGDSWQTCDLNFLLQKLAEEFSEIILASKEIYSVNRDQQDDTLAKAELRKELADLINVASMLHQRLR